MHDPMVMAFAIRRPWPNIRKPHGTNPPCWQWRWGSCFAHVAGRELYFPSLITVWHVEPNGEDALRGECRGTRWQWHVHHWHIQWDFLQNWRRRLLTRCEWCGGRSRKGDAVNHSHQWENRKQPWWRGERGLFHSDCSSVERAHNLCLCDDPLLDHGDYGQCAFCGKFRAWRKTPNAAERYLADLPVGARIPAEDMPRLEAMWQEGRS